MKVKAYRCDYCGKLQLEDDVVGVLDIADLFDTLKSYPMCINPEKANVHHCTECSRQHVMIPADREAPRKKDERLYQLKFNELYYLFKSKCVNNVVLKKKFV